MPTTVPSPHILFPKLPRHLLVHTTFSTTHTTTHTSLHTPRQHNITPSRSPLAFRAVPCPAARPNQNTNNKKKPVFFPGTKETNPPSPITPLPCHTTEKNRTHGATPVQSDMDLGTPAGRPAFNHPPTPRILSRDIRKIWAARSIDRSIHHLVVVVPCHLMAAQQQY